MRALTIALAAIAAVALPSATRAEERITSYSSDVRVERSGDIDVTETLDVNAEGISIRHGIYRDFPTTRRVQGQPGNHVGFKLLGVTRDGADEPYKVQSIRDGMRVRIGSANTEVSPGAHRYTIHYRSTRQIGHFADFDELYWNATGNGWGFPIDRAEVRITLPSAVPFTRKASYTGPAGATSTTASLVSEAAGSISYVASGLGPQEGLTVAVGWPMGVVDAPSSSSLLFGRIADWLPWLFGAGGLVWLLAYYARTWLRIGRDPRKGTIVPLFSPPDNLSPAALRYILKRGFDNRAFAATLVSLGVKGKVRLVEEEGGFFRSAKQRIDRASDDVSGLPREEAVLYHGLLAGDDSLLLDQDNHSTFSSSSTAVTNALKTEFGERFYHQNLGAGAAGCGLLAAAAVVLLAVIVILGMLVDRVGPISAFQLSDKMPLLLLLPVFPLALIAFALFGAPTKEGRAMMDRIEGFKHYLSVTEADRFDRMQAPEETLSLFEKYLPYAIALGVETRWAKRFESQIAAALASPAQQGTALGWYSGSSSPWSDIGGFTDSIGASLATSIGSASADPSSGSGGGGSSGGGGGGGGGGGW
ncbi:DUF2207 domain-containing protein [Sphingomonas sp.]|uniref:DUF2207 domain-containing protein n=1 Tax=Sphingomonas sp. TaxID=28214 RepID=UPI0025DD1A9A|nr:DUF2207 domain-containing protein [Sphingomonas sp.]